MNKKLLVAPALIVMATLLIVLLAAPSMVFAYRGSWVEFTGWVQLDGNNVPSNSQIFAWVEGKEGKEEIGKLIVQPALTTYFLHFDYIGDDPVNGAVTGDIIHFKVLINGKYYVDPTTAVFEQSQNIKHSIFLTTPLSPQITTVSLPKGTVGKPYTATLMQAEGGMPPYNWSYTNSLPAGLNLSQGGSLSGTLSPDSIYTQLISHVSTTFKVTDANSNFSTRTIDIEIEWIKADANGDGEIDLGDRLKVIRILMGLDPPNPAADANGDGEIDIGDAIRIERIYFGLD